MPTERVVVTGLVQGVGFRNYVHNTAVAHGVRGEVWNDTLGSVGIIAEHAEADVLYSRFLPALFHGPGKVSFVIADGLGDGGYARFDITRSR